MDSHPRFHRDALIFLRSLRWFGGSLAQAEVLVCAVDQVPADVRRELEALGAEVRLVRRFLSSNGSSNRFRWFEEAARGPHRHYLHVDCDVFVARDPLALLRADRMQAKLAPVASVTAHVFERLFQYFALPLPAATSRSGWTSVATIPYYNAGVLAGPAEDFASLLPSWRDFNTRLAAHPELAAPCEKHLHQAALALALAATGTPLADAPPEFNFQLNNEHLTPSRALLELDPALVHHHGLVDEQGLLRKTPYPIAQWRIERLNSRLRALAVSAHAPVATATRPITTGPTEPLPQPETTRVFVLGMHRAGTSAVTRTLNLLGLWVGPQDRLPEPDEANPLGYWENSDVVLLNDALLAAGGARWSHPFGFSVENLSDDVRGRFVEVVRELTSSFDRHGDWVVKDPRLCLTLQAWLDPAVRSVVLVVHRDPLAIARSLRKRHGLSIPAALRLWEFYLRAAVATSRDLPRLFVAYEDLVSHPEETAARWQKSLTRAGLAHLRMAVGVGDFVDPRLNRNGGTGPDWGELTGAQLALARALDDAARGDLLALDQLPPFDPTDAWLFEHDAEEARRQAALAIDHRDALIAGLEEERRHLEEARRQAALAIDRRDGLIAGLEEERRHLLERLDADEALLGAVFESAAWRLGNAAGRTAAWLLRPLRRPPAGSRSAFERWRARRRREE